MMKESIMLNSLRRSVFLLIVIGSGLIFIGQILMISQTYYDGALLRASDNTNPWQPDGALISVIDDTASPLQNDDLLVEINGQSLSTWIDRLFCLSGQCDVPQPPSISAGTRLTYTIERDGERQQVEISSQPYPLWQILSQSWGGVISIVITYLLFLVLWMKQPDIPAVQAMVLAISGFTVSSRWQFGISVFDILSVESFWWYQIATQFFYILASISFFHFALVFPRPLPLLARYPQWRIWLYPLTYLIYGTAVVLYATTTSNKLLWLENTNTVSTWLDTFTGLGSLVALAVNYRMSKFKSNRQHVQVVIFAIVVVMLLSLALLSLPQLLFAQKLISDNVFSLIALIIPLTIIYAIQHHNLWNIEPLVNRTLVYASLSAIILSIYMLMVTVIGEILRSQTSSVSSLIATGVVAILFQPLRARLQRIVNRIMYGDRDDPARVLSQLAYQLETGDTKANILPNLVQTIAHTLKIPYVAIWVPISEDQMEVIAEWGKAPEQREMIALTYNKQTIGQLIVAPRSENEQFSKNEYILLNTIATLTATTVQSVQLSDELRQSRQRIVTAREEERRRIRRDLHDGLGPQLASQTLGLEAIAQLMRTDPDRALSLIQSLQTQADEAIHDVRRLVYDLRPPALDDLGLVAALEQTVSRYENSDLHFDFELSQMPDELPAAVETAIFRIAQEAITNVVRHANATHCIIRLYVNAHDIYIEVEDNGQGLSADHRSGVGLQTMRERAAELNGDTIIEELPAGGIIVKTRLPIEVSYD